MGNGRQIWGESVQRPTGTPEPAPNPNANPNNGGGDGGGADDTPKEPVVLLGDGRQVPIEEFDPYKEKREKVDADRERVDGMLEAAKVINSTPNPADNPGNEGGEGDPPPHPLLADNPLLEEVDIENTEFASDFERDLAIRNNNIIQYARQQNQVIVDREKEFTEKLNEVSESISDRFVREDIQRIEATTGVTQEEIVAANRETGIADVDTLATLILGAKARDEKIAEAEAAAQKAREHGAAHVSSPTHAGGTQGGNDEPRRGVKNWRDAKEVAAKYNFKPA